MLSQFSCKMDHCCCIFRAFGPVLLQFSCKMDHCCCSFRALGDRCCCSFRAHENYNNTGGTSLVAFFIQAGLHENCNNTGPPSVVAVFVRTKTATTLVPPMHENCNNNGPFCTKIATTLVRNFRANRAARKLQQDWSHQCCCNFRANRAARKLQQDWSHQYFCSFRANRVCDVKIKIYFSYVMGF